MYGRYVTPSHMQMEVNHEIRGRKMQDAHVSLRLDADGMLGTRAFLRKQIKDDIKVSTTELCFTHEKLTQFVSK